MELMLVFQCIVFSRVCALDQGKLDLPGAELRMDDCYVPHQVPFCNPIRQRLLLVLGHLFRVGVQWGLTFQPTICRMKLTYTM